MQRSGRPASFDPTTLTDEPYFASLGGDRYRAGRFTMSPWDPAMQHGSPPTALLVHAMVAAHPAPEMRVARVGAEFLGAIPRTELAVRTRVARPGRRIEMLDGELVAGDRAVLAARVWRIAAGAPLPPGATPPEPPPPRPGPEATERDAPFFDYAESIEWRYVRGGLGRLGGAQAWMRVRAPLLAGEPLTALDRVLLCVDSANGIAPELPFRDVMAVPPALTVTLARDLVGEWMLLDARTILGGDGVGITTARYFDDRGEFGAGAQPLLLAPR